MWVEAIYWATADGTAIANTVTETIIFPNVTFPANYFQDGRAFRIYAMGRYSTTGTPTLVFSARWGGVSGTLLAKTTTITGGSGITNAIWELWLVIQCRSNGATGTLFVAGWARLGSGLTTPAVGSATAAPGESAFSAAASQITPAAVTCDLTADTAFSLTGTWSAASSSDTLTGHVYIGEALN